MFCLDCKRQRHADSRKGYGVPRSMCQQHPLVSKMLAKLDFHVIMRYNSTLGGKLGRGVRVVYGAALEKRSPIVSERGFESHPLRGEVLEWTIRRAWRARGRFTGPWVRIPPSPLLISVQPSAFSSRQKTKRGRPRSSYEGSRF